MTMGFGLYILLPTVATQNTSLMPFPVLDRSFACNKYLTFPFGPSMIVGVFCPITFAPLTLSRKVTTNVPPVIGMTAPFLFLYVKSKGGAVAPI